MYKKGKSFKGFTNQRKTFKLGCLQLSQTDACTCTSKCTNNNLIYRLQQPEWHGSGWLQIICSLKEGKGMVIYEQYIGHAESAILKADLLQLFGFQHNNSQMHTAV